MSTLRTCRLHAGRAGSIAALTLTTILLASCGGGESPSRDTPFASAPREGGTLVVALAGEVNSWNPYTAEDALAAPILDLVYPRLFVERLGPEGVQMDAHAATEWAFESEGRRLRVTLSEDARWTSGEPLECRDLVFTLAAQRSETLAWPGVYLKERIEKIECPSPKEALVHFSQAYPGQLLDLNDDALVPSAYGETPLEAWRSTPWERRFVGAGPFTLARVDPGQGARLVRNEKWWREPGARVDAVELRVYPEHETAIRALVAGEVDVVPHVQPMDAARVEASERARLLELPSFTYTAIVWNVLEPGAYVEDRRQRGCDDTLACDESVDDIRRLQRDEAHPVLADIRVRRALTLAADRDDLVEGIWMGRARVGSTPIVSALGPHDAASTLPFDPAEAARLLDEAGWRDRDADGTRLREGLRLEVSVLVNAASTARRAALERLAAGYERVGVSLQIEALPRRELGRRVRGRDFDGLILGWRAGTRIEPQAMLHTDAALNQGNNFGTWSTPTSDRLMDEASRELDPARRSDLWRAWQHVFRDEQPMTVLYEESTLLGLSWRVRDATPSALNPLSDLHTWWLADTPQSR